MCGGRIVGMRERESGSVKLVDLTELLWSKEYLIEMSDVYVSMYGVVETGRYLLGWMFWCWRDKIC